MKNSWKNHKENYSLDNPKKRDSSQLDSRSMCITFQKKTILEFCDSAAWFFSNCEN